MQNRAILLAFERTWKMVLFHVIFKNVAKWPFFDHVLLHSVTYAFLSHFNRISFFHDFGDEKCQFFYLLFLVRMVGNFIFHHDWKVSTKNIFLIFSSLSDPDDISEHSTWYPVNFGHFTSFLRNRVKWPHLSTFWFLTIDREKFLKKKFMRRMISFCWFLICKHKLPCFTHKIFFRPPRLSHLWILSIFPAPHRGERLILNVILL